jgi:hypothetical protein
VEKTKLCTQIQSTPFQRVKSQVLARPALFAEQGIVVATWRRHGNSRLGPYYRLQYFDGARRSIYLGRDERLAEQVRRLLADLQLKRTFRRLHSKIRKSLRNEKIFLKSRLHAHGYRLKGFEIHKIKS